MEKSVCMAYTFCGVLTAVGEYGRVIVFFLEVTLGRVCYRIHISSNLKISNKNILKNILEI